MGRSPFCFHWHFHLIPSFPLHSGQKYKSFRQAQSGLFFFFFSAKVTLAIDGALKNYHTPFPQLSFLSSSFPLFVLFFFLEISLGVSSERLTARRPDVSRPAHFCVDCMGHSGSSLPSTAFPAWQCTCSSNSGQPGAVSGQLQLLVKPAIV